MTQGKVFSSGRAVIIPVFAAAAMFACGGAANSSDAGNNSDGGSVQPTLSDIQAKIFTPTCSTTACHTTASAANADGLDLSDGKSYANLVNVASTCATMQVCMGDNVPAKRVVPGSPSTSFLYIKIAPMTVSESMFVAEYGLPMPEIGMITTEQISAISTWIQNGAQND